jgi:DNA invertase Pin-like site-specific DNA recombinase
MTVAPQVPEEDWEEACRREDEIRRLVAQQRSGVIGRAAVQEAARKLGISVTHLYRLIRFFRKDRRVSVLQGEAGMGPPYDGRKDS